MHQSRRTHNAHRETQRRLAKVANAAGYKRNVKYVVVHYNKNGRIMRIDTPWDLKSCLYYGSIAKSHSDWRDDYSLDKVVKTRKQSFYIKVPKSIGRGSGWTTAKRVLHKKWRRKGLDEASYTYKGSGYLTKFDYF